MLTYSRKRFNALSKGFWKESTCIQSIAVVIDLIESYHTLPEKFAYCGPGMKISDSKLYIEYSQEPKTVSHEWNAQEYETVFGGIEIEPRDHRIGGRNSWTFELCFPAKSHVYVGITNNRGSFAGRAPWGNYSWEGHGNKYIGYEIGLRPLEEYADPFKSSRNRFNLRLLRRGRDGIDWGQWHLSRKTYKHKHCKNKVEDDQKKGSFMDIDDNDECYEYDEKDQHVFAQCKLEFYKDEQHYVTTLTVAQYPNQLLGPDYNGPYVNNGHVCHYHLVKHWIPEQTPESEPESLTETQPFKPRWTIALTLPDDSSASLLKFEFDKGVTWNDRTYQWAN